MSVQVKICGLNDAESVAAAVEGGARYVGFVFYSKSPRFVGALQAGTLIENLSPEVTPVGLFVDPRDLDITRVLRTAPLRMIQLHGAETPERVAEIRKLTGLPVIKAVGIGLAEDVEAARLYESVADFLLVDAKPVPGGMPGGNGMTFDWPLLKSAGFAKPWFLAGGLNDTNIALAAAASGARMLDVSSGVEDFVGRKNPAKIKAFLAAAHKIEA